MDIESWVRKIPTNALQQEIVLTPGESILLLLSAAQAVMTESEYIFWHQIYLLGCISSEQHQKCAQLEVLLAQKNYRVNRDFLANNEDACRRYFETHLAYYLLQHNAEKLDFKELQNFVDDLEERLQQLVNIKNHHQKMKAIKYGIQDSNLLDKYQLEYAELIYKLQQQKFYELSATACKNLELLALSISYATLLTQLDKELPLDLYTDYIFEMGMDGRGRIIKGENKSVHSSAKGLMKSYSPCPYYDDLVNPESSEFSPFIRSADQAIPMGENRSVCDLFFRKTQIYVNGISSTTLAFLRNLIYANRLGKSFFSNNLDIVLTNLTGLIVYNSGGHSFTEVGDVFKLLISKKMWPPSALSFEVNMFSPDSFIFNLLHTQQKAAYNRAFNNTLDYFQIVLNKRKMHSQLAMHYFLTDEHKKPVNLHQAIAWGHRACFLELMQNSTPDEVNALNAQKWTPLMVAAQFNRPEYLRDLLVAGAKINLVAYNLTALEVAIKCGSYENMMYLLEHKALIRRKKGGTLKNEFPALYYALFHEDDRFVNELLLRSPLGVREVMNQALTKAIELENFVVIKALIIYAKKLQHEVPELHLFNELYQTGNTGLFKQCKTHCFFQSGQPIKLDQILNIIEQKNFPQLKKVILDDFDQELLEFGNRCCP